MMYRFKQWIADHDLSLIVSLPRNSRELAEAAIDAGADGIKFHINVKHRASGNEFGPLQEYEELFTELRSRFNGLLGIVLGDALEKVGKVEVEKLIEIGFDYYSLYTEHVPGFLISETRMAKTFAIAHGYDPLLLEGLASIKMEALEISMVAKEEYGSRLQLEDVLTYAAITQKVGIPTIIPSQRYLVPEDVQPLKEAGISAIMLGAVVTGQTPDSVKRAVHGFKEAMEKAK
jgi:hypothetical protein